MKLASQKDFFSGLLFMLIGAGFAWGAPRYEVGQAAQMGPGYFPLVLGVLLVLLGAAISLRALWRGVHGGDRIGAWAWRPLLLVLSANLAFGLLLVGLPAIGLPSMGLILAVYALVGLASLAQPGARWRETLVLATVLAAGSYVAFVRLLQLPLPVWPAFL